jgi:8-oxo-dGTP diphosphatase
VPDPNPYRRRVAAGAVVFDAEGRILLVRQGYGDFLWDIPAGAGDPGESAQDTAIRELREEAGLDGTPTYMTGVYHHEPTDTHDFVFLCQTTGAPTPMAQPPETVECGFFSLDALPEAMTAFTRLRIDDATRGAKFPLPTQVT